jgi:glycosyltransferase involved in cell wall biosynthesis
VKVLQLVSDWKWTGPAEPMLVLMRALRQRGHRVELVCPEPPSGAGRSLAQEARRGGLGPIETTEASRSAWRPGDAAPVRRLAHWLASDAIGGPFDIVHCWHSRDHVLAARALSRGPVRRCSSSDARTTHPTRIVRSWPRTAAIRPWPWNRWLFGRACDGLLCVSREAASGNRRVRPEGPLAVMPGAVDLAALRASSEASSAGAGAAAAHGARRALGVPEDAFLIGIVARMQTHRRFDLLLAAMARLVIDHPEARLVIFGRGTRAEEVVEEPARALGLEQNVVRAGYRTDDYLRLLAAMDLFTYLVPGSDGSCRALREAAALGLPLVGTRRGAIPEIIVEGETGLLVDEDPAALAGAFAELIRDPVRRRAMGEAARRDAHLRFEPERQAEFTEWFYESVWRSAPTSSR